MKKILSLITCSILLGCDPDTCTDYFIKNQTNKTITVTLVRDSIQQLEYIISPQTRNNIEENVCGLESKARLVFSDYDSILVSSSTGDIKTYYVEDEGKNFYHEKWWPEIKVKKRQYEVEFEITDDDFH